LKKVKPDYKMRVYTVSTAEAKKDSKSAEKMILALLFEGGNFIREVREKLLLEDFKDSSIRDIIKAVMDISKEDKAVTPVKLINYLENNDAAAILISEAVNLAETLSNKEKIMSDCIARIKSDNTKDRLERLQDAIRTAHSSKDDILVTKLVTEYTELLKGRPVKA
jgi:replicative DNA helicase